MLTDDTYSSRKICVADFENFPPYLVSTWKMYFLASSKQTDKTPVCVEAARMYRETEQRWSMDTLRNRQIGTKTQSR